jgi:hypothetical protein
VVTPVIAVSGTSVLLNPDFDVDEPPIVVVWYILALSDGIFGGLFYSCFPSSFSLIPLSFSSSS